MLYLTRKIGESIIINNTIELTVVELKGRGVKLGFSFPPEATILRKELHDRIMEQNLDAARLGDDSALLDEMESIELSEESQAAPEEKPRGEGES